MNSMIIKCNNRKCQAYQIDSANIASNIDIIDMDLPIKNTYCAIIVEMDGLYILFVTKCSACKICTKLTLILMKNTIV